MATGGTETTIAIADTDLAATADRICDQVGAPITKDEWSRLVGGDYDPPCR